MPSKDGTSTYFWIVPERLGQIPIEVSAVSGYAGDAVRRLLLVEVCARSSYCYKDYKRLKEGIIMYH